MNTFERIRRPFRIARKAHQKAPSPPFLMLFINSICNMKCEHCFYGASLNKKDDHSLEELVKLSKSLGKIENLDLSGGDPLLRKDFSEVCRQFISHNGVRQICAPSNGYFTDRTIRQIARALEAIGTGTVRHRAALDKAGSRRPDTGVQRALRIHQ